MYSDNNIEHPLLQAHYSVSPRITGGAQATPHQFPYQVGLIIITSKGITFCGGSLISRTTVLTAAHCVEL